MTRRCCRVNFWVVEWGDTYDHSLAGVRGRPADRTLMVEPESAKPIWKTPRSVSKLVVPMCPRRENGHLWRFDRECSTGDCQADVCQACGLVRMTSYRTGQVVRCMTQFCH